MKKLYLIGLLSLPLLFIHGQKTASIFLPPSVTTPPEQTVVLPVASVPLAGSATAFGNALISGYVWSQVAGPNKPSIAHPGEPRTTVSGLIPGTYVFELLVPDSKGATGTAFDTLVVTTAKDLLSVR